MRGTNRFYAKKRFINIQSATVAGGMCIINYFFSEDDFFFKTPGAFKNGSGLSYFLEENAVCDNEDYLTQFLVIIHSFVTVLLQDKEGIGDS